MKTFRRIYSAAGAAAIDAQPIKVRIFVGTGTYVEAQNDNYVSYLILPSVDQDELLLLTDQVPGHIYRTYDEDRYYINDDTWYIKTSDTYLKVSQVPINCGSIVGANQVIFPAGKIR